MPECGYCRDCKWYGTSQNYPSCKIAICQLSEYCNEDAVHPESLAIAMDYEAYYAALYPKPTHGCVQWEPRA